MAQNTDGLVERIAEALRRFPVRCFDDAELDDLRRREAAREIAALSRPPAGEPTHRQISLLLHEWLKWCRPLDECSDDVRANFNQAANSILELFRASPSPQREGWKLRDTEREMMNSALKVAVELRASGREQHDGLSKIIAALCAIIEMHSAAAPQPPDASAWKLVPEILPSIMITAAEKYMNSVTLRDETPITKPRAFRWQAFWSAVLAAAPQPDREG